jgi:hypothetical protein
MNNVCPVCGALYNVAPKDLGRRLRCKKCSASLKVTDDGLELDSSGSPPADEEQPPEPEREERRDDGPEDEPRRRKKRKWAGERERGPSPVERLGGLPTVLFGAGVFLVIVFVSFPIIGRAASERAAAYKERLENDREQEKLDVRPRKPRTEWSEAERARVDEETPKIEAKYSRLIERAELDAKGTKIANVRDAWFEAYGLMFGFLLLSFGCIGYLRTEQPLVLRIVAATILTLVVLVFLAKFTGCGAARNEADAGAGAPYPKAK